ncbi:hypothetical protein BDQ12DRAFT_724626 [Crucibulum laeve]|uniref:Uncharacterized protein n=1 Tax=Crucibulum laeve TaxID=68775 RepID=A0A5C3M6P6_9AGAR|nr:hypothetical protein BDQ12DRAFT_724626 [Crucibulum laeve]
MASAVSFLEQSFYFNYNDPGQPVPIPVTAQCDAIHLVWERSTATGPNPTAPYYLQVYTSTFIVPFIIPAGSGLSFDWAVPFSPGTQYQICMFDKNGNTGGCQATYTVIPPTTTPKCENVTFPAAPLDIQAEVDNGPMSQFGWIDQCTDISVTPKNGTPPYTFTVAPALHPPYNITSNSMTSMNWTVSLSWASSFFVSVVDSTGNVWSNGPLHSGGNGPTSCLSDIPSKKSSDVKLSVAVGSGVGGLVLGLLAGISAACVFTGICRKKRRTDPFLDLSASEPGSPHDTTYMHPSVVSSSHYRPVPSTPMGVMDSSMGSSNPSANSLMHRPGHSSMHYQVEPFLMPGEHGQIQGSQSPTTTPYEQAQSRARAPSVQESHASSSAPRQQGSVYVVHHDSGRAPVTVYHEDGTQVVELPPRYPEDPQRPHPVVIGGHASDSRSNSDGLSDLRTDPGEGPAFLQQPRRAAQAQKPAKGSFTSNPSAS